MSVYPNNASVLEAVVNVSRVSVESITRLIREDQLSKEELLEELRILALALSPETSEKMKCMRIPTSDSGARLASPETTQS